MVYDVSIRMSKPKTSRDINIPDEALKELLTPSEMRMLRNRYQVMNLLKEGLTIRKIAEKVKVGTDTVVRVAKMADKNSLRKLVDKTFRLRSRSTTPWIFGKSS